MSESAKSEWVCGKCGAFVDVRVSGAQCPHPFIGELMDNYRRKILPPTEGMDRQRRAIELEGEIRND